MTQKRVVQKGRRSCISGWKRRTQGTAHARAWTPAPRCTSAPLLAAILQNAPPRPPRDPLNPADLHLALIADNCTSGTTFGVFQEGVYSANVNGGLFSAMAMRGDIKMVNVGHDHVNGELQSWLLSEALGSVAFDRLPRGFMRTDAGGRKGASLAQLER